MKTGEKDTKRVGKGVVLPASELANQRPQIRILDIRVFFHLISLLNNTVFFIIIIKIVEIPLFWALMAAHGQTGISWHVACAADSAAI